MITKKQIAEQLRAKLKVFSTYDITARGHPFIIRKTPDGRSVRAHSISVSVKGYKVVGVPWYDNGNKCFVYQGKEGAKQAYKMAFAWIKVRWPALEMVQSPFHRKDFVPKIDLDQLVRITRLKKETTNG